MPPSCYRPQIATISLPKAPIRHPSPADGSVFFILGTGGLFSACSEARLAPLEALGRSVAGFNGALGPEVAGKIPAAGGASEGLLGPRVPGGVIIA
jgi:hypothetical protein